MNSEIFWRSDWYEMYRLYNNFVGQEMNVQPTSRIQNLLQICAAVKSRIHFAT